MSEMGRVGNLELLQKRESEWHKLEELTPASDEPLLPPMVTIQLLGGRKEKLRPGDLLGALTGECGFVGSQIGKINVTDFHTYVAVDRDIADQVVTQAQPRAGQGQKDQGATAERRAAPGTRLNGAPGNQWPWAGPTDNVARVSGSSGGHEVFPVSCHRNEQSGDNIQVARPPIPAPCPI